MSSASTIGADTVRADLRDAEAFERLGGQHEVNGRRFDVRIVLS